MIPASELTGWCFQKLISTDEYLVPLHKLWSEYSEQTDQINIDFEDFERLLRSDRRFYVSSGANSDSTELHQHVLSQMGLPPNVLVGLAEKKPSGKELDEVIKAKANQMLQALRRAWDARPEENREVERKLLFLMEQAKKLCDAVGL